MICFVIGCYITSPRQIEIQTTLIRFVAGFVVQLVVIEQMQSSVLIHIADDEVMFPSLFVCLSVRSFVQKNFRTDLHEFLRKGWQWANEQTIKFWWPSGSG